MTTKKHWDRPLGSRFVRNLLIEPKPDYRLEHAGRPKMRGGKLTAPGSQILRVEPKEFRSKKERVKARREDHETRGKPAITGKGPTRGHHLNN